MACPTRQCVSSGYKYHEQETIMPVFKGERRLLGD